MAELPVGSRCSAECENLISHAKTSFLWLWLSSLFHPFCLARNWMLISSDLSICNESQHSTCSTQAHIHKACWETLCVCVCVLGLKLSRHFNTVCVPSNWHWNLFSLYKLYHSHHFTWKLYYRKQRSELNANISIQNMFAVKMLTRWCYADIMFAIIAEHVCRGWWENFLTTQLNK